MTYQPRVLLVDDDELYLETYLDLLAEEGYLLDTATSRDEALQLLEEKQGWAAVLLDQKLKGQDGPDQGIDIIEEVTVLAPSAKIMIVTGYASKTSIEAAFEKGVYDFIEKTDRFRPLLLAKVRNAVEAVRDQYLATLDSAGKEAELRDLWKTTKVEKDPQRKGRLLEDLLVMLFRSLPGFSGVKARRRNHAEEFDVLVRNESADPFWANESQYFLVECKHWKDPVGRDEIDVFRLKMKRRHDRCRLGFFVALGGFSQPFRELARTENGDALVILIDRKKLEVLMASEDRHATLKQFHEQAALDANGA
jgi:CheY-like chemotaxis protein